MNKSTTNTKEYDKAKSGEIQDQSDIKLLDDQNYGYGINQMTSQIGIRGIKWRGSIDDVIFGNKGIPNGLKEGDLWYNVATKKLQAYTSGAYNYNSNGVPTWLATQQYSEGDYVIDTGQLYVAIVPFPTVGAFLPLERRATNLLNTAIGSLNYAKTINPTNFVPTLVLTEITGILEQTTDDGLYVAGKLTATQTGKFLIISHVKRFAVTADTKLEHYIYVNGVQLNETLDPGLNITITSLTTGTDSIGGAIIATTISTVNYGTFDKTTELIDATIIKEGDIIEVFVKHNKAGGVNISGDITLIQL